MYSFEVHSNESACGKNGRRGMEQVLSVVLLFIFIPQIKKFNNAIFSACVYLGIQLYLLILCIFMMVATPQKIKQMDCKVSYFYAKELL